MAKGILESSLEIYTENGQPFPMPAVLENGQPYVEIDFNY